MNSSSYRPRIPQFTAAAALRSRVASHRQEVRWRADRTAQAAVIQPQGCCHPCLPFVGCALSSPFCPYPDC